MSAAKTLSRVVLSLTLLGSLGACTVVPAQRGYYRPPPAYVETYPVYGYGYARSYRDDHHHHDEHRGYNSYRDQRSYREPVRIESPLESAARTHRNIRRSLGLPRLPGMP